MAYYALHYLVLKKVYGLVLVQLFKKSTLANYVYKVSKLHVVSPDLSNVALKCMSTPRASLTSSSTTFPIVVFSRIYSIPYFLGSISTPMLLSYLAKIEVFALRLESSMFKKG